MSPALLKYAQNEWGLLSSNRSKQLTILPDGSLTQTRISQSSQNTNNHEKEQWRQAFLWKTKAVFLWKRLIITKCCSSWHLQCVVIRQKERREQEREMGVCVMSSCRAMLFKHGQMWTACRSLPSDLMLTLVDREGDRRREEEEVEGGQGQETWRKLW